MSIAAPATNPASDLSIKLPATIGTAGQVLKNSDTAGTLEFGLPPRPYRNLIINGAMQVAQRGTSSTSGDGYNTVDRIKLSASGPDENPTQTQHALTSSDTGPWEKGFRYSWHMQNGNQTSGAGASDVSAMVYKIESQDIAQSGWDYTSSSKDITMSFWIKSSVAQAFYVQFIAHDVSGAYNYTFSTGSLSADTWTKVTHSIPGNSNLVFDNDNGQGFEIYFYAFNGTNNTDSGFTLNAWAAYSGSSQTPDMTSTWYTTNDSTLEFTGVQLEVGDTATEFEHRSYTDELFRCQRYYFEVTNGFIAGSRGGSGGSLALWSYTFPTPLRASPTITALTSFSVRAYSSSGHSDSTSTPGVATSGWTKDGCHLYVSQGSHSIVDDRVATIAQSNHCALDAEL